MNHNPYRKVLQYTSVEISRTLRNVGLWYYTTEAVLFHIKVFLVELHATLVKTKTTARSF